MPAKKTTTKKRVTKGRSNLKASKKFNWKKLLPVVLLVAIVGGFFVWRSFAAAKPGNYQYSVYTCKPTTREKPLAAKDQTCHDYSAEATTYRMYRAILKADPSSTAYKQWTQQMAGGDKGLEGRLTPEMLARRVHGMPSAKTGNGIMRNKAVVTNIYLNVYGNANDKAGIKYWQDTMRAKKWSVPRLLHEFVNNKAVIAKLAPGFKTAMTSNKVPKITVIPIARQKQEARTAEGKRINAATKKVVDQMKDKSRDNNARKQSAGAIASQAGSQISSGDLNTIKNNYINVISARVKGFGGKDYKGVIEGNYTKVKALYDASERVKSYSPDITNYGVTTERKIADNYRGDLHRNYENAKWLLSETNRAYSIAKKKHDDHQAWVRAKQACEAKGGTFSNWHCTLPTTGGGGTGGDTGGDNDNDNDNTGIRCPSGYHAISGNRCFKDNYTTTPRIGCYDGYTLKSYRDGRDTIYFCKHNTSGHTTSPRKKSCPAGYKKVSDQQCTWAGAAYVNPI